MMSVLDVCVYMFLFGGGVQWEEVEVQQGEIYNIQMKTTVS